MDNDESEDVFEEQQRNHATFNRWRVSNRAIDELIGLCRGLIADKVVNSAEVEFLKEWFRVNDTCTQVFPGNEVYSALCAVDSGDPESLSAFKELLEHFVGGCLLTTEVQSTTLPLDDPAPEVVIEGSVFVLTGTFAYGIRRAVEHEIVNRGGFVDNNVRQGSDYLVVGTVGSHDWIHSSYGRKIILAVENKGKGCPIKIISEDSLVAAFTPIPVQDITNKGIYGSITNGPVSRQEARARLEKLLLTPPKMRKTKGYAWERQIDLIADFSTGYADSWHYKVIGASSNSLDIGQMNVKGQLTQGIGFCFPVGAIAYDNSDAYEKGPFCFRTALSVIASTPVNFDNSTGKRFSGQVKVQLLKTNKERTQIEIVGVLDLSQDDFVRALISGPERILDLIHNPELQL